MNTKTRITKLEKRRGTTAKKFIIMHDAYDDQPAKFDGVEMTQAEADAKAAALGDGVNVVCISYTSDTGEKTK